MLRHREAKNMKNLFEHTDGLNHPIEAFHHRPYPGNFPILPHWHYFIEIILLTEGRLVATCDDAVYHLLPGDLMIFCPQKIHSIDVLEQPSAVPGQQKGLHARDSRLYQKSAEPQIDTLHNAIYPIPTKTASDGKIMEGINYQVLKFDLNFLNTNNNFQTQFSRALTWAFEDNPENIYFSAEMLKDFPIENMMEECITEINRQNYGYDMIASSVTTILLTTLMRVWLNRGLRLDEIIQDSISSNKEFEEITGYIEKHYNETLQVQDLADRCNMSYSYFAKLFRKTYNQSCKEYIEFIRLSKVQDLLRFTNLDLTYISQETGFSDCSHLIRTFKKKKGTTPKKWRRENSHR